MRLKELIEKPFICFCFLVQLTLAHQNVYNTNFKNNPRTYPKKYFSTSTAKPPVYTTKRPLFPNLDNIKSRIAKLDSDSGISSSNSRHNSDIRDKKPEQLSYTPLPRLRHHGWSNRRHTTTTTTTTLSPFDEEIFSIYGDLEEELDRSSVNKKYSKLIKNGANFDAEDKIRIRHYGSSSRTRTTTTTTSTANPYYDLFDDDDDFDEEDFDEAEDDDNQGIFDNIQAEEPSIAFTERSRPAFNSYQETSLTAEKWEKLGTLAKVEKARNDYYKVDQKKQQWQEHVRRINESGKCKKPVPKVVQVNSEHPDPSVKYQPECTVLHRCAEDTGCCRSDSACQYKTREEVTLYFYVKPLGAREYRMTNLTFFNHTECQCRPKKFVESVNTTERLRRIADHLNEVEQEVNLRNSPEMLTKCKCPKQFIPKLRFDSTCYCDCDIINKACLIMKKGREHLSYADRVCILNGECQTVSCQYGSYNNEVGKCPTFEESR